MRVGRATGGVYTFFLFLLIVFDDSGKTCHGGIKGSSIAWHGNFAKQACSIA